MALRCVGQEKPVSFSNEKISVKIKCDTASFTLSNVLVVENLALPLLSLPDEISEYCVKKTGVYVKPYQSSPEMLIGQDFCQLIISREIRQLDKCSFMVSRCLLGWSIHGKISGKTSESITLSINDSKFVDEQNDIADNIDKLIRGYFSLEALGIENRPRISPRNSRALEILDKTSRYNNQYWEVGLLWKSDEIFIPNSRTNALNRLKLSERKLDKDPQYATMYIKEMNRLIDRGFAIRVNSLPKGRIWYLPHFGVHNINKPGKVRLVFDAAAKSESVCFNDLLLTGQDLYNSLLGVLMRFRQNSIAIKGDLHDMFLKIKIRAEDRDAQRFLWRGNDKSIEPQEYVMSSLLFGATSSPCTAIYILNKNAQNFISTYPETVNSIQNNCYMDDFLDSCETIKEAEDRVQQVKIINNAADWEMHGWVSNNPNIFRVINNDKNKIDSVDLSKSNENQERILGLQWLTISDSFTFKFSNSKIPDDLKKGVRRPTKREFLSITMAIYDPLVFISPFTIEARVIMQNIWASKIKWDDRICDNDFQQWKRWLKELESVENCRIPRCYKVQGKFIVSIQLHVFCNASEKAYAAVAYWRFKFLNNKIHTAIVSAKSRVVPLKSTTIPRLELQAAILGVRLAKTILKEHTFQVEKRTLWSDSQTVLNWMRSDSSSYKTFVMNRLGEISEESKVSEWRWFPTFENPADDATRWVPESLKNNSRWFLGPLFLRKNESSWPVESYKKSVVDCSELREKESIVGNVIIDSNTLSPYLSESSRFSSWNRLIRSTARVLEAVDRWSDILESSTDLDRQGYAECLWILELQQISFKREICAIQNSKPLSKDSRIISLTPFLDNQNLLRARGRIEFVLGVKKHFQPLILDSKDYVVQLLIKSYHEKIFHKGHETVINELQQNYWILGARKTLRSIINKCTICRILRANPINTKMANLPLARLGYKLRAFSYCGLDFFGPIAVKIGRRREKRWGALFTCMTTRAIHIELAHSLNTDSAIMAIQRFAARRGFPLKMYSDNGTNFRGASQEIKSALLAMNKNEQRGFALKNNFDWHFNPPSAPHMGGAWERLIRSVKESLFFILKEHAPSEETLLTVLAEVEHSVNSRPLTHVSSDPLDKEALTPNHFLLGTSCGTVRLTHYDAQLTCVRKQWRLAQHFADAFWNRWLREYLPSLLPRKKWFNSDVPLKIGDLVLILDNETPRNTWRKGLIIKTLPGADGEVRIVEVKTAYGTFLRPSRKIVKIA